MVKRRERTSVTQTTRKRGSGPKHPPAGQFSFFGKNCCFNAIWITFRSFLELLEITKLLIIPAIRKN